MGRPPETDGGARTEGPVAACREPGEALRPAAVRVDLAALDANVRELRTRLGAAEIMAVVKADAYGHGAGAVAKRLQASGVARFAVALPEEGAALRSAGVEAPILVLGTCRGGEIELYFRHRLTASIVGPEQLALWCEAAHHDRRLVCHLKVDTGMTRLGFAPQELGEALQVVRRHPGLELEGLFTHLADADLPDSPRPEAQDRCLRELLELLDREERERLSIHVANSAGALHHPFTRHRLVRLGLALYGVDPAGRADWLQPVMAVEARIVASREVAPGARVGYGGRWQAERPSRIAIVPVGYGDGYPWRAGADGEALVRGRRVPLAGAVSMDMLALDVTGLPVEVGEPVVLLGGQRDQRIDAAELAEWAGTIPYEILCRFGQRLPRRYEPDGPSDPAS